ncbi:MAG: ABC transporter permease [Bryobacterales bacterium]|nr:ABC transporter permease [Bryobacterales bacterium]
MSPGLLQETASLAGEHLYLVAVSTGIAAVIGISTGLALAARPAPRRWAIALANIFQTIPSLALFGFLIPLPFMGGIGPRTAILALVLYAILPMLRNTVTGILGIDPAVRESAIAMGMTDAQRLWQVEIPLALPVIFAGLRVAVVTTIGTATIAAAIGAGGLGVLIFRGVAMVDTARILAGAIPAAAMALIFDGVLGWIEDKLSRA